MSRTPPFAAALLLTVSAVPAGAQEIQVQPVARQGHVYVSFSMLNAYTDDVRETILSGLPVSFTYDIELRRAGSLWFDRTVAATVVAASVRYDNLARRYHVTRTQDGKLLGTDVFDTEGAVRDWLMAFGPLPLFASDALEVNSEYSLRVRARTSPRRGWPLWPWGQHDASGLATFTFVP